MPRGKVFFDPCFYAAAGGTQTALDADDVLRGCTLKTSVVPTPYEALVEAQGRAHQHFLVGCKVEEDVASTLPSCWRTTRATATRRTEPDLEWRAWLRRSPPAAALKWWRGSERRC